VAGAIGVVALLTVCNNPSGDDDEPVPPYVGPDSTQTDTTKTDTTKTDTTKTDIDSLDSWKPLTQVYMNGFYDFDAPDVKWQAQDLGWCTAYSTDGQWNPNKLTSVYILLPDGKKLGPTPTYFGEFCGGRDTGWAAVNENIVYGVDGSRGCRAVPESENELGN